MHQRVIGLLQARAQRISAEPPPTIKDRRSFRRKAQKLNSLDLLGYFNNVSTKSAEESGWSQDRKCTLQVGAGELSLCLHVSTLPEAMLCTIF